MKYDKYNCFQGYTSHFITSRRVRINNLDRLDDSVGKFRETFHTAGINKAYIRFNPNLSLNSPAHGNMSSLKIENKIRESQTYRASKHHLNRSDQFNLYRYYK